MNRKKVILFIWLLLIQLYVCGQTTYLPKLECGCPESFKYCAAAFDSLDFHKNFHYVLCAGEAVSQQGIFLKPDHFEVKKPYGNKIVFRGQDSIRYEVWSKNEVLKISVQVNTMDFAKTNQWAPQHAVTYSIDSIGRMDSSFTFYFPRVNSEKTHQIVQQFYSDLEKAKQDSKPHFFWSKELGSVLLATLNGDKEAKKILMNFYSTIKDVKNVFWSDDHFSYYYENAITLVRLQDQYCHLK